MPGTVYVYSREGGFYRCSKQSSEHYVEEYQKAYGLDYTILRYGSLYGPRADNTNGLFRIVDSALKSGKIQYKGDIESMREYIHVEDAARASVSILDQEFINDSIILTGQEPMRVLDLLKILAEIMNIPEGLVEFTDERYQFPLCKNSICLSAKAREKIYSTNSCRSWSRIATNYWRN